jgi:hypothetical protein
MPTWKCKCFVIETLVNNQDSRQKFYLETFGWKKRFANYLGKLVGQTRKCTFVFLQPIFGNPKEVCSTT